MEKVTIVCETCERTLSAARVLSLYEQQALESRPCPHCGAYTLACHESEDRALAIAGRACRWTSFSHAA